jgi:hypothetical protein
MMFNSKRTISTMLGAGLAATLLAALLAACGSVPVLIPIPVSSDGEPVMIILVTPTPAAGQAAADASDAAATEEAATEQAATEQAAEDVAPVAAVVDAPSSISHKYVGREECTECHEAGEGKHASPENHAGYTDDLCLFCHAPREEDVARPSLPEEASAEFCLTCHGSFEELAASTEDLVEDFDGVKANPHMYVPHDSDKIAGCDNCHDVHELPIMHPEEIPQADAGYCFAACHHEETFEPCTNCHEEGSGGGE